MKIFISFLVVVLVLTTGCSSGDPAQEARLASYNAFAQKAYEALAWEDVEALVDLCALPGDLDMDGSELVPGGYDTYGGLTYSDRLAQAVEQFIGDLNSVGGTPNMQLVRIGKPIGLMGTEIDFVGNMFLIVEMGGQQRAIELGSSQLSRNRGRVILPGEAFSLKDMQYYQEMASIF